MRVSVRNARGTVHPLPLRPLERLSTQAQLYSSSVAALHPAIKAKTARGEVIPAPTAVVCRASPHVWQIELTECRTKAAASRNRQLHAPSCTARRRQRRPVHAAPRRGAFTPYRIEQSAESGAAMRTRQPSAAGSTRRPPKSCQRAALAEPHLRAPREGRVARREALAGGGGGARGRGWRTARRAGAYAVVGCAGGGGTDVGGQLAALCCVGARGRVSQANDGLTDGGRQYRS